MQLVFHKMHGLGNDFMLLDVRSTGFVPSDEQIRAWADRNTGIGFDQLITIGEQDQALQYRFFNADGGEAEQCGNGQRCIAMYLHRYTETELPVEIHGLGGPVQLQLSDEGYVATFRTVKEVTLLNDWPQASEQAIYVDLGNPHVVLAKTDIESIDMSALEQQSRERFPAGINVEVVEALSDDQLAMRVYERGVGETQACGSGACAALIGAGHLLHMPQQAQVAMPGGTVVVKYDADSGQISLSGPASYVFQGHIETTI